MNPTPDELSRLTSQLHEAIKRLDAVLDVVDRIGGAEVLLCPLTPRTRARLLGELEVLNQKLGSWVRPDRVRWPRGGAPRKPLATLLNQADRTPDEPLERPTPGPDSAPIKRRA